MKYNPTYDGIMTLDLGLNGQAGQLIDLINEAPVWATIKIIEDGEVYYHLAQTKIMGELPTEFGSPQSVTRCIQKLSSILLVIKRDGRNYYRVPKRFSQYWGRDNKDDGYKALIFELCGNDDLWKAKEKKAKNKAKKEINSSSSWGNNSENGSTNSENGSTNSENGSTNSENGSNNITNPLTNNKTNNNSSAAAGVFADMLKQHRLWVDMNRPDHRKLINDWAKAGIEVEWLALLVADKIALGKARKAEIKSVMFFEPVVAAEWAKRGKRVGDVAGDIPLVPASNDHAGLDRWAKAYGAPVVWRDSAASYEDWRSQLVSHRTGLVDKLELAA